MSEIENRLRVAFAAVADTVSDEAASESVQTTDRAQRADRADRPEPVAARPRLEAVPPRRSGTDWRAFAVIGLAAAVVLAAIVAGVSFANRRTSGPVTVPTVSDLSSPSETASQTPSASPSATSSASPTANALPLLGLGQEAARASIPWAQVGPGWSIVSYAATPTSDNTGPLTVYLLNPIGGRYKITTTTGPGSVIDWSGDRGRLIMQTYERSNGVEAPGSGTFTEIDLRTGDSTVIPLAQFPRYSTIVGYTRPSGAAILVRRFDGSNGGMGYLVRIARDGSIQQQYPRTTPDGVTMTVDGTYSADGSLLAVQAGKSIAILSNSGAVLRTLPLPPGQATCSPQKWWSSTEVLATCADNIDGTSAISNVWILPASGAAATALTKATANTSGSLGYFNATRVTSGILVANGFGCGFTRPELLGSDGLGKPFPVNLSLRPSAVFADHLLTTVNTAGSGGCVARTELVSYTYGAASTVSILGGQGAGNVVDVVITAADR